MSRFADFAINVYTHCRLFTLENYKKSCYRWYSNGQMNSDICSTTYHVYIISTLSGIYSFFSMNHKFLSSKALTRNLDIEVKLSTSVIFIIDIKLCTVTCIRQSGLK